MTNNILDSSTLSDLGLQYADLVTEEGRDRTDAYGILEDKVKAEYDADIWELVDRPSNVEDLTFEDHLEHIMEQVEAQGEYYIEQREEAGAGE